MRTLLLLLLSFTASAADPATPPSADDATVMDEPEADPQARLVAMHRHLALVNTMHDAVIAGNLALARAEAEKLSKPVPIADMPDAWDPYLETMRDSAARAADRWESQDAALTVADIARTCATCHAFVTGGPPVPDGAAPTDPVEKHGWAMTTLWLSLVAGDQVGFNRASLALQGSDLPKVSKKAQVQLRALGTRGVNANSRAIMADTYAALLGSCADCHGS